MAFTARDVNTTQLSLADQLLPGYPSQTPQQGHIVVNIRQFKVFVVNFKHLKSQETLDINKLNLYNKNYIIFCHVTYDI